MHMVQKPVVRYFENLEHKVKPTGYSPVSGWRWRSHPAQTCWWQTICGQRQGWSVS